MINMTQRDKIREAYMLAQRVKGIARSIKFDANDYDVKWPIRHADDLEKAADEFLKLMK